MFNNENNENEMEEMMSTLGVVKYMTELANLIANLEKDEAPDEVVESEVKSFLDSVVKKAEEGDKAAKMALVELFKMATEGRSQAAPKQTESKDEGSTGEFFDFD